MITFEEALTQAKAYLQDSEIPLQITRYAEFSEGWYFCFQSKEYLDTKDPSLQLAGNGPFIVDKDSGDLHFLGTAYPIEVYLEEYAKKNARM